MAPDVGDICIQKELAPRIGTSVHDEYTPPPLELLGSDVNLFVEICLQLCRRERHRGVRPAALRKRRTAGRTEVGSIRIPVPTVRAIHRSLPYSGALGLVNLRFSSVPSHGGYLDSSVAPLLLVDELFVPIGVEKLAAPLGVGLDYH